MRFTFASVPVPAVAILPGGICAIELTKTRKGLRVEQAMFAKYTDSSKDWSVLTTALSTLVADCNFAGKAVTTCMSATQLHIKMLEMPAGFTDQEIEAEIIIQLMRGVTGKKYKLNVDFIRMGGLANEYIRTYCVAARTDHVQQYQQLFANAGVSLQVIDVDVFALIRAADFIGKVRVSDRQRCLLYVSAESAVMAGWQQGILLFHQYWEAGTQDFMAWLDRCCHAFHHYQFESIVVMAEQSSFDVVTELIGRYWSCAVMRGDLLQNVTCRNAAAESVLFRHPEAFAALGLGLRGV